MVRLTSMLGATALLLTGSVSARAAIERAGETSLYAEVARNKDLQSVVQEELEAEEQLKKKPKPVTKVQADRDLEDKKFEERASHIRKFSSLTVIGDSYASGDGAYSNAGNGSCRRNAGAFGFRLNKILKPDTFAFIPCSGAPVKDIQYKQVESKQYGQPDLVVFTAGGDNGGSFVKVLLSCILQPSEKKCDKALEYADKIADDLPTSLAPLYQAMTNKESSGRKREIIHLGYVQMYNRDAPVEDCPAHGGRQGSDVTWPSTGKGGYRDKINKTIVKINSKIKEAAHANGVTYLDPDSLFSGHRFCDGPDAAWMQHRLSFANEGGIICHPTWEGHSLYIESILNYLS